MRDQSRIIRSTRNSARQDNKQLQKNLTMEATTRISLRPRARFTKNVSANQNIVLKFFFFILLFLVLRLHKD